jgi:hypothetical protein
MSQRKISTLGGESFFEDYGFDLFRKQNRNFKERVLTVFPSYSMTDPLETIEIEAFLR